MKIALLGHGTVGSGVIDLVQLQPDLEIKLIYVRPGKEDGEQLTSDFAKIINDDEIEVVVEALGGLEPAHTMIVKALQHHKSVVTANKAVVAQYMAEFQTIAQENEVQIKFEASVGGGIPILHNMERSMRINHINSINGIFNGTSNFILDQMHRTKRPFDDVLKQAQDLGYAEADPSADIDGLDVENKLSISADLAFDTIISPNLGLYRWGIRNITAADIDYFEAHNWVVKQMGTVINHYDQLSLVIEPVLYNDASIFSTIHDNLNYIQLDCDQLGAVGFMGQGAGKLPTADAVLQDVLDIKNNVKSVQHHFNRQYHLNQEWIHEDYLVRTNVDLSHYDSVSKDGNYYRFDSIDVGEMHSIFKNVLKKDPQAFATRISD